jgi:CelD/BcsL family acetyltransferase involved in cellulose biosynthesis
MGRLHSKTEASRAVGYYSTDPCRQFGKKVTCGTGVQARRFRLAVLQVSEVLDDEGFHALEKDWQALFDRAGSPTPFQSWEWMSSWWRHHREGKLFILVARDNDVVVGILPLRIERYRGSPFREVRWMGAPLSDYQDQIAVAGREAECTRAFFDHLWAQRKRWDFCDLNDLREGHPLALLCEANPAQGLRATRGLHRMCPVIALPPTVEELRSSFGTKLRNNLKRRKSQLEKAFRVELAVVENEAELPQSMDELFTLHNSRWRKRGVSGAFSSPRVQAFHQELARRFLARGWLRLSRLRLDGVTRAAFYSFHLGKRTYHYLPGFDLEISKFGPGAMLMANALERAVSDGDREFDLLRGDESYKYGWGAVDTRTERLVLGHSTLRSRLALLAHRFERFVERKGVALQRRLWGQRNTSRAKLPQPNADPT